MTRAASRAELARGRWRRSPGSVIRYNMAWTLVILVYLILIGLLFYYVFPGTMQL
jgi:lactate permease